MSFANPWGLLALLAIPAIVMIHLYHRRFPPLKVAGLHLWTSETRQPLAGRRRERLPVSTSLILEVLAAGLLALVLSQPRLGNWSDAAHLVVVLDNTASMSARPSGKASFRDQAVAELERRFAVLPRGSVVTLLLTGVRPESLGHALPLSDARERLKSWRPTAVRHTFESAFDTAVQVADVSGKVLFLTNRPVSDGRVPEAVEVVALGEPLENVAVTAARWTYDAALKQGRLFLRVQNFGVNAARVRVRGTRDRDTIFERKVSLAGGAGTNLESHLPGGLGEILIEASRPDDGLALDGRISLLEPHPRLLTVANELPQNHAARESVQRILAALPEIQPGSGPEAHLLIASAAPRPESNPRLWWLGVGPLTETEAARKAARDLKGPFLLEKRHPLLEGITCEGVIWGGVQPLPAGTPLISSGNNRLLAQLTGSQTVAYLLNIDFARSNLSESPDWPIFVSNLIELRRQSLPGLQRWNYRLGEEVSFRLFEGDAPDTGRLTLERDGHTRPIVRAADIQLPPFQHPGVYTIREGDRIIDRFAVNFFDSEVSQLRNLRTFTRESKRPQESQAAVDARYTWAVLAGLLLILGCLLADWWVLGGGISRASP